MKRVWIMAALAWGLAGSAIAADPPALAPVVLERDGFSLKPPAEDAVAYHGAFSYDAAGIEHGQMMYGGGLIGLVVGVTTHAVIAGSAKDRQLKSMQVAADRMLEPYKAILAGITHRELMQQALVRVPGQPGKLTEAGDAGNGWIVETLPVFWMAQDSTSLVLENMLVVHAPGDPKTVRYRNVVKVVSDPSPSENAQSYWTEDDGRRLKEESVELFAHSLRLLMEAAAADPQAPAGAEKSVRYMDGSKTRIERAQVVRQACGRNVLKTLRGWWMSVPVQPAVVPAAGPASAPTECPSRYAA